MRMVMMLLIILQFEYHCALVASSFDLRKVSNVYLKYRFHLRLSGHNFLLLIGKNIVRLRQHNKMRLNILDFDGIEYLSDSFIDVCHHHFRDLSTKHFFAATLDRASSVCKNNFSQRFKPCCMIKIEQILFSYV